MTQNDKELLIRDLCARLPYGVIVHLEYDENTSITREMGLGSLHDIMFDYEKLYRFRPIKKIS